ncbi:MAG: AMIN domain-containing protein [Gemmatimonadales bacterium]|jgi:type IV pilus assembly protein PilQ
MMLQAFILAVSTALSGDPADVTELRVEPVAGYTEVVVRTSDAVSYSDFLLTNPARLIVDLKDARHALAKANFDDINRGGVVRVRTSQFRDDVVRVVVELTAPTSYTLTQQGAEIRVSFPNLAGDDFESWASGSPRRVPQPVESAAAPKAMPPQQQTQAARQSTFRQEEPLPSQMPRITVTFESTDMRDVLNNFAEFTGKSIVPGVGVQGNVTANIRNQPWDLALKAILDAHGLTAVETATGIIRVDELQNLKERQALVELQTQIFKVNYAPVQSVAEALAPAISERGKVISNEATNSVIVTDVPENLEISRQIIGDLDVRTPQVVISSKIIFIDRTDIEEIGVGYDLKDTGGNQLNTEHPGPELDPRTWELVDSDFDGVPDAVYKPLTNTDQVSFKGSSLAALANAEDRIQFPALELLTSVAVGDFQLFAFVDALQRLDLSDIVAAPTIQTMDNQAADILVGEETPIRIIDYGAGGAAGGAGGAVQAQFPQSTVEFKETGIKLEVTPHITFDRKIVMDLLAERSGIQLAPGDLGFTFQTQRGTTRLILEDGETGVIGGLTVTEVTKTVSGVPLLMDLPLLGPLFRTTRSNDNKSDLLILVTPHIVDDAVASIQ